MKKTGKGHYKNAQGIFISVTCFKREREREKEVECN